MIHMNQQPRYQGIYAELQSVYRTRGTCCAHYTAGMCMGYQIAKGLSNVERDNLDKLLMGAVYAK